MAEADTLMLDAKAPCRHAADAAIVCQLDVPEYGI